MAYLQLHAHVSYGLVAGRAVFLDLRGDRYLALDRRAEAAFALIRGAEEPVLGEGPDAEHLLRTGLFRTGSLRGRLAPVVVQVPPASVLDAAAPRRTGWTAVPSVWRAVTRARERLARQSLRGIVEAIRESRHGARGESDSAAAEEAARVFLAARAMVPIERSCLLDALALLDWLGSDASHAALVFGVQMGPFAAHCWLQSDSRLLTDGYDTVRAFAPVLAV